MNRRSFLAGLGLAPVVAAGAAVAVSKPYASGGYVKGSTDYITGESGPEFVQTLTVKVDASEAQKAVLNAIAEHQRRLPRALREYREFRA